MGRPKYRVKIICHAPPQHNVYIPQYRVWWWPFWQDTATSMNEGGGVTSHTCGSSKDAWKVNLDHLRKLKTPTVEIENECDFNHHYAEEAMEKDEDPDASPLSPEKRY